MAPVEGDGQTDCKVSAGSASQDTEVEVSRRNDQQILEHQAKGIKGRFTTELKTVKNLMLTYEEDFPADSTQFDSSCVRQLQDAEDIVTVLDRLTDRYNNIVNIQEEIRTCICTSIALEESQVDKEIAKAQVSLESYQVTNATFKKEFAKTIDRVHHYIKQCKSNRAANSQANSNPTANNVSKVPIFKPQSELKPQLLGKECQLLEFTTWGKNFVSYIKSSSLPLPEGAINENLRVNMDPHWYVELQEKGLNDNTTLDGLTTVMSKVAQAMFPIHQRRIEVLECKQKSDSKTYLRELIDKVRMAEWKTFNDQAAICQVRKLGKLASRFSQKLQGEILKS